MMKESNINDRYPEKSLPASHALDKKLILMIEDDRQILDTYVEILTGNNYDVVSALNAADGIMLARDSRPDIILLDINLPDRNGDEILGDLRSYCDRIIIMSGKYDKLELLGVVKKGADDFMIKPIIPEELLVKIYARLRDKNTIEDGGNKIPGIVLKTFENILEKYSGRESVEDNTLGLSKTEMQVLAVLMENAGSFVSIENIMLKTWGYIDYRNYENLQSVIKRIRKKIKKYLPQKNFLTCKYYYGYKWNYKSK